MTTPAKVEGACNCGAVGISIVQSSFPSSSVICGCLNCRASCGSLFSVNLPIPMKDVEVVKGQTKVYNDKGDSGHAVIRHFCGDCGSPVFSVLDVDPNNAYVKGGLFKQFGVDLPPPGVQFYHKNKENWESKLPGGHPAMEKM